MHSHRSIRTAGLAFASAAAATLLLASAVRASDPNDPPFDFSNAFYLANGIDPAGIIGRPDGTPPNSVLEPQSPGPDFNNVRILQQTAAFDDSGHPIFFYVTGVLTPASFTNDSAGADALQIAEQFKVYEFPRSTNPQFSVFPKRQDLLADLSGGYFSNDPLGIWQINLVRYTPAAFNTPAGQAALADLAADNGLDLDGTPVIRTKSEIEDLEQNGFIVIETPPIGGPDLRWFLCPVIKDPRDGAIAPDAFLEVVEQADGTPLQAEQGTVDEFNCLQSTGDFCNFNGLGKPYCGVEANSTGEPALLEASGSASVAANDFTLRASQMPPNRPVLFITAPLTQNVPFGEGRLCVAGGIKRFNPAGVVAADGTFQRTLDLTAPPAAGAIVAGTTWSFQAWFRDPVGGPAGWNLTHGLTVAFQ